MFLWLNRPRLRPFSVQRYFFLSTKQNKTLFFYCNNRRCRRSLSLRAENCGGKSDGHWCRMACESSVRWCARRMAWHYGSIRTPFPASPPSVLPETAHGVDCCIIMKQLLIHDAAIASSCISNEHPAGFWPTQKVVDNEKASRTKLSGSLFCRR